MSIDLGLPQRLTPAPPPGELIDSPPFPSAAIRELANPQQRGNLHHAMTTIRAKRAAVVSELDNWEQLRQAGEQIKNRVLANLDVYLIQLERSLTAAGATVHWARDAQEADDIVVRLAAESLAEDFGTTRSEVVKVKSMATQEIDLNEAMEAAGIAAWETDLAELIVQLGHDRPSHILVPAIHRNRAEVREIFLREMQRYGRPAPEDLDSEPEHLAAAARLHLREKFLRSKVAISGANFAVAETGHLAVVESEGNGRMCLTLPETLISVVGIEKILPTFDDLEVFLQLLPRSSTGERMNPYTTLWAGSRAATNNDDGPRNVHVVLLDNGRTNALADPAGRAALRCIRCSACINVCPVYEKVGGHAYGSVYPGPIGAILTPQLRGPISAVDRSLPFASSLCGACTDVCPVRIPIAELLVHERAKVVEAKKADQGPLGGRLPHIPSGEAAAMAATAWMFSDHRRWEKAIAGGGIAAKAARSRVGKHLVGDHIGPMPGLLGRWTGARDVPLPPGGSFRQWWAQRNSTSGGSETSKDENHD